MVSFANCISKFFIGKESNKEWKISNADDSPCLVSDEGNFDKISGEGNLDKTNSPEKTEERVETKDYPWDLKLFLDTCTTHKRGAVLMSEPVSVEKVLNHRNSLPSEDSNQEPQVKHMKKKKRKRGKENKNNSENPKPKRNLKRCKRELGALQSTKKKDQENSQRNNSSEVLVAVGNSKRNSHDYSTSSQKATTVTPPPLPQAVTSAAPAFRKMRKQKSGFRTVPLSMHHFDPLKAAMYPAVVRSILGPILARNVNDKIVVVIPSDISSEKKMRFACPDGKTVDFSLSELQQPIRPNMVLVLDLTAARKKISDQTSVSGNNADLAVLAQTALYNRFVSWINKGSCKAGRSSIKSTQQPRVLLEDVNEEMLRALPSPYSDKFQKVGFTSLKSIRYPVLILRPTDAPIRQRLEWLAMYQRHLKGNGPLLHMVVYFGFPAIKTETCLSYGLVRSVLLYEEAANRNCHTLPSAIQAKVDKGTALNAKERSLLDGFAILDAARETSEQERLRLAQDIIMKKIVFNKTALRMEELQQQIPGDARAKFLEVGFAKFKHRWYPVLIIDPQYLPKRQRCEWLCRFWEHLNGVGPFLHSVIFYGFPEDDEKYGLIETVLLYEEGLKRRCHELPTAIKLKIANGCVLTAHDQHVVDGLSFLNSALKSKKQDRLQNAKSMGKQKKTRVLSNLRDDDSAPDKTASVNTKKNKPNKVLVNEVTPNVAVENEVSGDSPHDQLVGETVHLIASVKKKRGRKRKVVANEVTLNAPVENEVSGTSSHEKLEEAAQRIAPVNNTRGRSRKVVANEVTLDVPLENEVGDDFPPEKLVGETAQQIAPVNKKRGRPRTVVAKEVTLGVRPITAMVDDAAEENEVKRSKGEAHVVEQTKAEATTSRALSFLKSALKSKKQDRLQNAKSVGKQKKTRVLSNLREPRKQTLEEEGIPSASAEVFLDSAVTSVELFPAVAETPSTGSPYGERQKILNQLEVKQRPPKNGSSGNEQRHLPKIAFDDPRSFVARHSSNSSGERQMCSYSKCKQFAVQSGVCFDHGANRRKCSDPTCTYWAVSSGVWCYKHGLTKKPGNLWV